MLNPYGLGILDVLHFTSEMQASSWGGFEPHRAAFNLQICQRVALWSWAAESPNSLLILRALIRSVSSIKTRFSHIRSQDMLVFPILSPNQWKRPLAEQNSNICVGKMILLNANSSLKFELMHVASSQCLLCKDNEKIPVLRCKW